MNLPPTCGKRGDAPPQTLAQIERLRLSATYANTCATSLFTVGVAAPAAASVFGIGQGTYPFNPLTLAVGMPMFCLISAGLHVSARYILRGLTP